MAHRVILDRGHVPFTFSRLLKMPPQISGRRLVVAIADPQRLPGRSFEQERAVVSTLVDRV